MTAPLAEQLVPVPAKGRVFAASRRVRLGDADVDGRCRLDAIARYLQDVSNDDTRDAGLLDDVAWVVRRTVVDVDRAPRLGETIRLATFCGGIGSRWAERRVSITGDAGAAVEAATLWVHIDLRTQAPKKLPPQFHELFGEAADGRTVSSKLLLPKPPSAPEVSTHQWRWRRSDFDVLGHVNNAAYWEILDEHVTQPHGFRAIVEFQRPVEPGGVTDVVTTTEPHEVRLWLVSDDGAVHAAALVVARV